MWPIRQSLSRPLVAVVTLAVLLVLGCGASVDEVQEETVDPPEELAASKEQAREDAEAVAEMMASLQVRLDTLEQELSQDEAAARAEIEELRQRIDEAAEVGAAASREAIETIERELDELETRLAQEEPDEQSTGGH